jgi:uncharacterized protein YndB with AHSA1/START domain
LNYQHTIDIEASPASVWAVLADVTAWPSWTASIDTADWVGDSGLAVGHAARLKQPKLRAATWTIIKVDEGRSFTWETTSPGVCVSASHAISPRDSGVRVTLATSVRGLLAPIVGPLTARIGRRYVAMEAEGLKRRCEERP